MKKIELRNGGCTLVSDKDYSLVNKGKWYKQEDYSGHISVVGKIVYNGKYTKVRLHRLILNAPKGIPVDHIDHNPLNNQRENLRKRCWDNDQKYCVKISLLV